MRKYLLLSILLVSYTFLHAQQFGDLDMISGFSGGGVDVTGGDINGDGHYDVVASSSSDPVVIWYENNGAEQFLPHNLSAAGNVVQAVDVADLDNDGDLDIAIASNTMSGSGVVSWLENTDAGVFAEPEVLTTFSQVASDVLIEDLDGDGLNDVLATSFGNSQVVMIENNGGGNFSSAITLSSQISQPQTIAMADIDGDGIKDVLVSGYTEDAIMMIKSFGGGSFGPAQVAVDGINGAYGLDVSDIDGDGSVDILFTSSITDLVGWAANSGDGSFGPILILSQEPGSPRAIAAEDFDLDGDNDIVYGYRNGERIELMNNLGGGEFYPPQDVVTDYDGFNSIAIGDINEDGLPDLLTNASALTFPNGGVGWIENVDLLDGLDENGRETKLELYPNPMTTSASIDLRSYRGEVELDIVDMNGRTIRSERAHSTDGILHLERRRLVSGHYLLRISHENGVEEAAFVVR